MLVIGLVSTTKPGMPLLIRLVESQNLGWKREVFTRWEQHECHKSIIWSYIFWELGEIGITVFWGDDRIWIYWDDLDWYSDIKRAIWGRGQVPLCIAKWKLLHIGSQLLVLNLRMFHPWNWRVNFAAYRCELVLRVFVVLKGRLHHKQPCDLVVLSLDSLGMTWWRWS